jgi:LAO/AO transport system kinase
MIRQSQSSVPTPLIPGLAERVLAGDRRAVARLISLIEDGYPSGREALRALHPHGGRAHVVGVTGPPGAGKSTLVRAVVHELRRQGQRVAVVAVDPTSPFTGGAILGDRVRMQDLSLDPEVFVRSMATRGERGGLARATTDVVLVLDAWGADTVLVETVGAGQGDVEIGRLAHTVAVVEVPQLGDDVQAIKAGILEIADVFVVNKADKDGADQIAAALEAMLEMDSRPRDWLPPVVKTVASTGQGVADLASVLARHVAHLRSDGRLVRRLEDRTRRDLTEVLKDALLARLAAVIGPDELDRLARAVARRDLDVYTAAEQAMRVASSEG